MHLRHTEKQSPDINPFADFIRYNDVILKYNDIYNLGSEYGRDVMRLYSDVKLSR